MKAEIVSITKPIKADLLGLTPEQFIVYQARVSSPHNQHNHDTGHKLLRYCLREGHWSVFDMVDATFEIQTSRAIMAQILRHHSFRFQEFSQRYAPVVDGGFYMDGWDDVEMRFAHEKGNRQGSDEEGPAPLGLTHLAKTACVEAHRTYRHLLQSNIAPESARMVLPLATPTTAYMKGSVRSWITYFWQRCSSHAQKEHRQLADLMFAGFSEHFPICADLCANGRMTYTPNAQAMASPPDKTP